MTNTAEALTLRDQTTTERRVELRAGEFQEFDLYLVRRFVELTNDLPGDSLVEVHTNDISKRITAVVRSWNNIPDRRVTS